MAQVQDNYPLLLDMLNDMRLADPLYRPTNYWSFYEQRFLPELRQRGLRDFRSRTDSILTSFGATDPLPIPELRFKKAFKGATRLGRLLTKAIEKSGLIELFVLRIDPYSVTPLLLNYVRDKFEKMGLDIMKCPTSEFGNPEDQFETQGTIWSSTHLVYCSMVADAAKFISFSNESVICELGSGMGRNIEVLGKLYPGATLLLFDIPPQLYVANQYLTSIFGDRVISYSTATSLDPTNAQALESVKGKIVILPSWKIPAWSHFKVDVFWNSASFQEMEIGVVQNYLAHVKTMNPRWIYINALPQGNWWGQREEGRGGVLEAVTESCYQEALQPNYLLQTTYETDYFFRPKDYKSYIFERR